MRLKLTLSFRQILTLTVVILLGLSLSLLAYQLLVERQIRRENTRFEVSASNSALAIKRYFGTLHAAINSIASLYDSSDYVSRQQFQRFVKNLFIEHAEITSIRWIPRVDHERIMDYRASAQYDGFENFTIFEGNKEGRFQSIRVRKQYFPVFFYEPETIEKPLLGFDLASNAFLLETLNKAMNSGQWKAGVRLAQFRPEQKQSGILLVSPIYQISVKESTVRERQDFLKGFTLAIVDINKLMKAALSGMQLNKDISVQIQDVTGRDKTALGYLNGNGTPKETKQVKDVIASHSYPLIVGQQQWQVLVENRRPASRGTLPLLIFVASATATMFAAYVIYAHFRRHEAIQQQVRERTHELKQHKDHLEEMVYERTHIIEQQAEELAEKLHREKELNELQRSFVSMASHEFRTPLAIIDTHARQIGRRVQEGQVAKVPLGIEKIRKSVRRMTLLMESILTTASLDEGKLTISVSEDCDVRSILKDCCQRQRELASDYDIRDDISRLPDRIVADPTALEQVFSNLLSNAVKYSPDVKEIDVRSWCENDTVFISVSDKGIGIDKDDLPKMFGRFFRAKTSSGIAGTGIGLNLIKLLLEKHGGDISLDSVKGKGTTFTVLLPITGPPASQS